MCDQVDDEPVKVPSDDLAHEIWAAAQTAPGEGIEDAAERVAALLAREAVRLNAQAVPAVPEITTALDGVVSSAELGAVLTYTTSGHSRPCGQIMGANGAGDFALLIYGKPHEAEATARLHIRELESAGYRIKAATLVPNEEGYSGPQIRTLKAPNAKMSLCPECGDKRCPQAKNHDNACAHGITEG
jgi:hypothetical protein